MTDDLDLPNDIEMSLIEHLEELRQRVFQSLVAVVITAAGCLIAIRPLVRLLKVPAGSIRLLQLAPGEFLLISLKVAGYAGLVLALPYILYQVLAFVLPGLTQRERRLIAPAVAGSAVLFLSGIAFAWWTLIPAALRFLVSYGSDLVEPLWSIERYLDFVLLLMLATGLAFQLPVLQLILGAVGLVQWRDMLSAWRWVIMIAAIAGAVLTPSTDPITMSLLAGAITVLFLIGVALVALTERLRPETPPVPRPPATAS
ncbi:twin-arginine translocase subunit TatC [cyanobiont of Ornithocercus magnificus]|nr:twin-arginine translocase subunit TatC [cyanobiont of Ornithocercus magnificus]